jgi:SLOG in TRPM, prokaryote/SMODS and SLOG-associating 2TM effector domain 1/Protein of unknown function (DUF4231)
VDAHKVSNTQLNRQELVFSNHNHAVVVKTSNQFSRVEDILDALDIKSPPKVIILIFGGAANSLDTSKLSYLKHSLDTVLQFAAESDALVIDGGTQSGIMEIIGERASMLKRKPLLLGVAPIGKVTYPGEPNNNVNGTAQLDPNHSRFILVEGDQWGDETETLFRLARGFDEDTPIMALLVGGGEISKKEIFLCVKNRWPIVVIEKPGYLADQIISYRNHNSSNLVDSNMKEIISYDGIRSFPLDAEPESLKQQIIEASNYDPLLELAWRNFTLYDGHANRLQKGFNNLQVSILTIGIVASALAVSQTQFKEIQLTPTVSIVFHYILIVLPISISVLVAISNRFRSGTKWVLLRAAAEAIKSEIYQYRARSHIYRHKKEESIQSLREKFSSTLEYINNHLMKTDVAIHGFDNYDYTGRIPPEMYGAAGKDDGYSMLSAGQYIKIRIGDQLNYYRGRVSKLHKQLKRLHWLILSIGGAGTFLAAADLQIWIALTTSMGAVFLTFLEYRQVENTIIKYNQTVSELLNIYTWWESLTFRQRDGLAYDKLVQKTEDTLHTELAGWIKQMEDAIEKLSTKKKEETNKAPK